MSRSVLLSTGRIREAPDGISAVSYTHLAVGVKVNNQRAVQFRKWAGQIVKDHTIQGWTMDVERLKKGHMFTDEYFERQLQQIREIRLSERKFYQKVTDLYATAFDYDKDCLLYTSWKGLRWMLYTRTLSVRSQVMFWLKKMALR